MKCITKYDGTTIDDVEDLDLVMPVYNSEEYSSKYSETTESLWFYSEDEVINFNAVIDNDNNFKSFNYKIKLLENTVAQSNTINVNGILRNATIAVLLTYLSNFLRSLEMPLINCKVELKLRQTKYCVQSTTGNDNLNNIDNDNNGNNISFTIKDTKLCVPVVTLAIPKAIQQREFAGKLKIKDVIRVNGSQSMFILRALEKIKET